MSQLDQLPAGAVVRARPWDVVGAALAAPMVLWGFLGWFGTVGDSGGGTSGILLRHRCGRHRAGVRGHRHHPQPDPARPGPPAQQPAAGGVAGRRGRAHHPRRHDRQAGQRHHPGRFGRRAADRAEPGRGADRRLAARQREVGQGRQRPRRRRPAGGRRPGRGRSATARPTPVTATGPVTAQYPQGYPPAAVRRAAVRPAQYGQPQYGHRSTASRSTASRSMASRSTATAVRAELSGPGNPATRASIPIRARAGYPPAGSRPGQPPYPPPR